MPVQVFGEWMNLVPAELDELRQAGRDFNLAVQSANTDVVKQTSLTLYAMARSLIERRKQHPLDPASDITTALLNARVDGAPLSDDMILGTVRQVLVVGIVAPSVIFGSICVHLSRHPELQQQLRADPSLTARGDRGIPAALHALSRLCADRAARCRDRRAHHPQG